MSHTYIKTGGVQKELQRLFVKDAGTWRPIKKIWVKASGAWKQVFGNTGSATFTTVGTTSWTPPPGVYSVNVTYPTTVGMVTTVLPVIPGTAIPVVIGNYGQASTFGSVTMPLYDKVVFSWSGNVDANLYQDVQVATNTGTIVNTSGYNSTIQAAASAGGIYWNVPGGAGGRGNYGEGWHGDLFESASFQPALINTLVTNFQCYYSALSGRQAGAPGYSVISVQPTAANNYVMSTYQYDTASGEGGYSSTFNIQQTGYFSITY